MKLFLGSFAAVLPDLNGRSSCSLQGRIPERGGCFRQDIRAYLTVKSVTAEEIKTQLQRLPEWIQKIPSTFLGAADAQSAAHTFEPSGDQSWP
jgi:hypothetical protein